MLIQFPFKSSCGVPLKPQTLFANQMQRSRVPQETETGDCSDIAENYSRKKGCCSTLEGYH